MAALFIGIFLTMIPALMLLETKGGGGEGVSLQDGTGGADGGGNGSEPPGKPPAKGRNK